MRVVDTLLPLNNAQAVFNQDSMVKNLASAEIQTHDLLNCHLVILSHKPHVELHLDSLC